MTASPSLHRLRLALRLSIVTLALALTWSLAPVPHVGPGAAEAAKSSKKRAKTTIKQRRIAPRPAVRVDPEERRRSRAEGKVRRGSSTPPPPYGGTPAVRPHEYDWDFGPGTIVQRRDQLRARQPRPPLRPLRPPRGYEPVPGPGHGPGTYISPIYPGTIGPTGPLQ